MAKVCLVTILFNSNDVLEGFFKSLSKQTYKDYHLCFVDNSPSATTDECIAKLSVQYPISGFSHIKTASNIGFAGANNVGIEFAMKSGNYEYFLITNNDIEFDQEYLLQVMVETADNRNEALVIPKIYVSDTHKIWMAGGYFRWWKAMGIHVGEWHDDSKEYDKAGYFNYAPLCIMLIKANVFKKIGLLDEKYFVYYEDTDFIYRAVQNGYKIYYCPQLKVLHKVGFSTGGYHSLFSIYYGNRNRIYFIRKHFGLGKKMIVYFYVLATRVLKCIKYDKKQREKLISGIKDGFAMKIPNA